MTNPDLVTITVLRSGLSVPSVDDGKFSENRIALRGEVLEIDRSQTIDARGNSWLDATEEEQIARRGYVSFRVGDHSSEMKFVGDDDERITFRRRERDTEVANKLENPEQRREALKQIRDTYGAPASTQRTLNEYGY